MDGIIGTQIVGKAQTLPDFIDELNRITLVSPITMLHTNNEHEEHFTFVEVKANLWDITFGREGSDCKIEHNGVDFRFLSGYLWAGVIIDGVQTPPQYTYTY